MDACRRERIRPALRAQIQVHAGPRLIASPASLIHVHAGPRAHVLMLVLLVGARVRVCARACERTCMHVLRDGCVVFGI